MPNWYMNRIDRTIELAEWFEYWEKEWGKKYVWWSKTNRIAKTIEFAKNKKKSLLFCVYFFSIEFQVTCGRVCVADNMYWQYIVHSVWMIQCSIIWNENDALANQFILFSTLLILPHQNCVVCILFRYYIYLLMGFVLVLVLVFPFSTIYEFVYFFLAFVYPYQPDSESTGSIAD